MSTNLENLFLYEYGSRWSRYHRWPWRRRPKRTMLVANPQMIGYPPNLPSQLDPNRRWTGIVRKRFDVQTGDFWVGIGASHTKRLVFKHIPRKLKP